MKSSPPTRSHSKDRAPSDPRRFIQYSRLNPHVSTSPERKEPASSKVKSQIQNVVKKVICNSYAALATLSEQNNPKLVESHEWNGLVKDLQEEEKRLTQQTVQSPKSSKLPPKEHSKVFEIVTEAQAKTLHVLRDSRYINEANLRLRIQEIFSKLLSNVESRLGSNKIDRSPTRDLLIDVQQENKELREKSRRMEEYVSKLKLSLQDQALRNSEEGLSQRDILKANELIKSLREDINEKSRYIQDQEFKLRSIRTESDALKQRIFDLEKKILSPNKSRLIREERSPILDEYSRKDKLIEVTKERDDLKEKIAKFSQYPGIYEKQIKKLKEDRQNDKLKLQELIEKTTSPSKYSKKYTEQRRGEADRKDRDIAELGSALKELNEEYLKVCNLYREQTEEMEKIKVESQKNANLLNERYQNKCKEVEELNKQMEEIYDINQMQKGRNTAIAKDPRARKLQASKPMQEESQKEEYSHIIEEKQQEIDRLTKQLACLKRERELQHKENRTLQQTSKVDSERLLELQKEDEEIRNLLENLYKDLKNLENEKNELLEQLSQRNNENNFTTENENLLKEIENKRKALREFEKREEELFNKYAEEKEKCENLLQDIDSYKDELKIAKDAWKQRETKIIEFKQKMKLSLEEKLELEAKINTMQNKINELEKELNNANTTDQDFSKRNEFDQSATLDSKEKKIEELNEEINNLKTELSNLKNSYEELEKESGKLYSELAAKNDLSLNLEEEINNLNNENFRLKEELSNQESKHKGNIKNLEFQINMLKKYEKMYEDSQIKSDQILKEKQDLLTSFENETIKSNVYINELIKDLEKFKSICFDKDEEIKSKNDEIIKLENILKSKEAESSAYEHSQLELTQTETNYQQKIDTLAEKLAKRKQIIKELNEIIDSHQKNSKVLEDTNKQTSEAYQNEIDAIKIEKNKLQLLTERQTQQLDELTSILELGKRQLETERIRNRNAQEELAQLKNTVKEEKEHLQEEIKKLKEGSDELLSAFEIKELRIKSLEEELDIAREDLQEEINSEQEIIEKYEEVEKELKKTKEKLNEITLENENMHKIAESSNEQPTELVLEIEKLNKEIKEKSDLIEGMKENIKKSKQTDADLQAFISQKIQENNHLLEEFEKYKEESLLKSQEQAEQFGKMLENKSKEIDELFSENRKHLIEREILQNNVEDYGNQINALNDQIEAMEATIRDHDKNRENLNGIIQNLENKIASLSTVNDENLKNIEILNENANQGKEEIYQKNAQIEVLENQIVELKNQISTKQNEILLQENEIKLLNDFLSARSESDKEALLLIENQRLSSELENIEIKFESIQEVYNSQKSYLLELQHKFDVLQASCNNLASELESKTNELELEKQKSDSLTKENHEFFKNFQKSESLLQEKEIEIQNLKSELDIHTKEFNEGRNKLFGIIDKQNEKINSIENSLQLKTTEFQKLTSENSSLSKQIYDLKDSLSEKISEIDLKHKTITSLEDSLACLKSQINDSEKSHVSKDNEEPSEILFEVSLSRSKFQQESEFTISKSVEIPFQYTEEDPKCQDRSVSVVWPQIEDLEKEIDVKTQELINKENELEELTGDYEKLEQCMCALERENIKLSQINNLLSQQLKEKIAKYDALALKINEYEDDKNKLESRSSALKKFADALAKQKASLETKAESLEQEISIFRQRSSLDLDTKNQVERQYEHQIKSLQETVNLLNKDINKLEHDLEDANYNQNNLRQHINELENEIAEFENKNEELSEKYDSEMARVNELSNTVTSLEIQKNKLAQQNSILISQVKEKTMKNEALNSQMKIISKENKALTARCESLKKLSNAISKEKTILNEKASELEEKMSLSMRLSEDQNELRSRNSIEIFQGQIRDSEIKHRQSFSMEIQTFGIEPISNIQESLSNISDTNINRFSDAEIEHLLAQISQLESRNSNLEKDKIRLSSTNMVISTQLKDKLKQIQSLNSQNTSFKEENEKLESRSQSLKKFVDAVTKEKHGLQSKIGQLEQENMLLSHRISLENESGKYLEEINNLRYSLDSLTNQNQSLEKQLEESNIKQLRQKHQQTPSFDCSEVMFQAPENTLQNRSSENLYQSRGSGTFASDISNTLSISKEDSISVEAPSEPRYKTNEERISCLEKEKIKLSQINLLVTSQLKEKMAKVENLSHELRESEENLRKQETRAANMKKYVDALVKENSILQANYEAAEKENSFLKEKNSFKIEEESKTDQHEIQILKEEIETLYESLSAEKQQNEELLSLLHQKSEKLYSTQSELEKIESKNQILEIKNEKLIHSNNMITTQLKDKISRNEALSSQVKRLTEENENMRNRISTMKKFIDALAKEKSNVQLRNEELENKMASSSQRVSLDTSLLSRQESVEDFEYLKHSLEDVLIRNKSLEDAVSNYKSTENELNAHIVNLENQIKNLTEDREKLIKENSEIASQVTKELDILKTQLNILEKEKDKLIRINALLKSQLNDKMTKNESLSTRINNYEQENETLHTRVSSMKKFIDALAREKSSLAARIETLEEENNLLKQKDSEDSKGNQEVDFDLSPMSMSISQRTSMVSEAFSSSIDNEKENLRNELAEMKRKIIALENQNENLTAEIEDAENQISLLYQEKEKLIKELAEIGNAVPEQYRVPSIPDAIITMENEIMIKNNDLARYTELIAKIDDELPINFRKLGILDAVRALIDQYETSEIKTQQCSSPAPHSKTLGAEFNLLSPESTSETFNIELNPSEIGGMHLSVEEAQQIYATLRKIEEENQEIVEARREQEQENMYLKEKLRQTEQTIIGRNEGGPSLLDLKMLVISLADMIGPQKIEIEACLKEIFTILEMTKEEIAQIEERRNKAKGTMEKTSKLKKLFSRSKKG